MQTASRTPINIAINTAHTRELGVGDRDGDWELEVAADCGQQRLISRASVAQAAGDLAFAAKQAVARLQER